MLLLQTGLKVTLNVHEDIEEHNAIVTQLFSFMIFLNVHKREFIYWFVITSLDL